MSFGVDVDTTTGDIGANTKTTDASAEDDSRNTTEVGSHNADSGHNSMELGSHNTDDHATTYNYYGVSPAAPDGEAYGGAAVHHGGYHADPAILALQQRLLENGFDPGPLDGVMGPRTEAALAAEQADYAHQQAEYGEHALHHHHHHRAHEHGGYEAGAGDRYAASAEDQDASAGQRYDAYPSADDVDGSYGDEGYAGESI